MFREFISHQLGLSLAWGFVVSQSVIVSQTVCLFCGAERVVSVVVVCVIKKTCPHCSQYFCNVYHFPPWAKCVWQSSGAANGSGPSASESRSEWCSRLLGWLACDGFPTLLVWMMLSAGQQKGHPSSWRALPLRMGRSSWMVRVQE